MSERRELSLEERLRDFTYHQVPTDIAEQMTDLRAEYYRLATRIVTDLPESREKSLALTHLEDSCMRVIQALAVQGTPVPIGSTWKDTRDTRT